MELFEIAGAKWLEQDIARIVVSRDQIARRIEELAGEITECYRGKELTVLVLLKGSVVFLADLIRRLPLKIRLEMMSASSYPAGAVDSQELRFAVPAEAELAGKDVLIVDDILDTGRTLRAICQEVKSRKSGSVRTCVLLKKDRPETVDRIEPDFCGFAIEPEFVVGYGLDFNDLYRNLPDICTLQPHVLTGRFGGNGSAGRTGENLGD